MRASGQWLTRWVAMLLAGVAAAGALRAAPIYVLRYAFTNEYYPGVSSYGFFERAVAGINDAGDVCGTFGTSNALDNSAGFVWSVYLLRTNGVAYDLFPRGVTPAVQSAFANNLTQRRSDGSVQIVGSVQQADGFQRGAIWTVAADGTISSFVVLTNLVLPTNSLAPGEQGYGEAIAINNSGYVVGDGNSYQAGRALYWTPPYASPPGSWGWNDGANAIAVDDQGVVLVNADFRNSVYPYNYYEGAALLYGGSPTELPPADPNDAEDDAFAMAGPTVVGQAFFGTNSYGPELPFAWERGDTAITLLPPPDGMAYGVNSCEADAVNTNGDIVGYVYDTNYVSLNGNNVYAYGSFYTLWKQNGSGDLRSWRAYALDGLLPAQPGFQTFGRSDYPDAYDIGINDHGDIALHYYGNRQGGYSDPNQKYYEAILVYQPLDTGIVQFFNTNYTFSDSYTGFTAPKTDGAISASVELVRADGYMAPVTVHFATSDGDGVAGQDYVATNGDLVWGYGETGAKTITVQLVTNNFEYGDRTFYLDLSGVSGAEIGLNHAEMHIYNWDWESLDFVNGTPGEYGDYAVQAGASNVVVTLRRDYSPDGTMVITNVETYDGSALAGVDYQSVTNTTPVTWTPGQPGSLSFSIPLLDTTNLYWPVSFSVQAQGTIDGSNSVEALGYVDILPPGQIPSFQFDTSTPVRQGNAINLTSFVEQGTTVQLQSSTNLVDWTTVAQVPCTNGVVQFNPVIGQGPPGLFYREIVQ